MPLCRAEGIAVLQWSPLGRGFLSGKYKRNKKPSGVRFEKDQYMRSRYFRPEDFDVVERLAEVAREKDVSPAQMALAWLLAKEGVTSPIVGVTRVQQLEELVGALEIRATADDAKSLEEPYRPHPVLGHQ